MSLKKKSFNLFNFLILISFLTINQVQSQILIIVDGDTIHLNGEKIRFIGIDAPELKQNCYNKKKNFFVVLKQNNSL